MTKKLNILLLCLFFSCSNTNNLKTEVNNKDSNSVSVMESKKQALSNLDGLLKLKTEFKLNDKEYFNQSFFDDNNNGLIFFGKNVYYINPKSETSKHDLGTYYNSNFLNQSLDKNGDGFVSYYPDLNTNMGNKPVFSTFLKFEKFIPKESIEVESKLPSIVAYINSDLSSDTSFYFTNNVFYKVIIKKQEKEVTIINKIELEKGIQIFNSIYNKDNPSNSIILTKEESENHKFIYTTYLCKNNDLDLLSKKTLNFKLDNKDYFIDGQIDKNGNGYIYASYNNIDIELKKISNYSISNDSDFFEDLRPNLFRLNSAGNGFIISNKDYPNLFLHEMKDYKPTGNKYLLSSYLDKLATQPIYAINKNGDGFILITSYKNIINPQLLDNSKNKSTYNNDMIIINNYKIVE